MLQLTSPRLPGVPLLELRYTGPEYARWRRCLKFALDAKGTWKYCNGKCTMPMPDAGTTATNCSTTKLQPCLLEERREWVKHDREVKLDVFLSMAEEVMLEVFEVGPPLPPSNMNAQEMLETLDAHFKVFKFEPYHHAFCHFLNLHIDQYPSIEEFNQEFVTTLEDLLDHGHPMSNTQACSAYFSKLRCTQNPWVAKKLEEWDSQPKEVDILELLQESPPWSVIRPLATKSSQNFRVESIPEEYLEDSSASDSEAPSEKSDASTVSSISEYSRQVSTMTMDMAKSQQATPERQKSVMTARSQEITIRASAEDISEGMCETLRRELEKVPTITIPERGSSKNQVPGTILSDDPNAPLPEWLVSKKSVARKPPPPHDRPLPPLPPQAQTQAARASKSSSKSSSPNLQAAAFKNSSQVNLCPPSSSTTNLQLETTHPTLVPTLSTDVHPALRACPTTASQPYLAPQLPQASKSSTSLSSLPQIDTTPLAFPFPNASTTNLSTLSANNNDAAAPLRRPSTSTPNLAIPWPSTPDIAPRPHSSRAMLPAVQTPNPIASQAQIAYTASPTQFTHRDSHDDECNDEDDDAEFDDDEEFLPLQGTSTRDSAWDYLYEAKGGYLITRERTVETTSPSTRPRRGHAKSSSLDLVARLGGENVSVGEEQEGEKEKRRRKKKSWSMGGGLSMGKLAMVGGGSKVREII